MNEEILYCLWRYKLLSPKDLYTSDGERVIIENPGVLNKFQGPDFQNCRIRIGKTLWFGHVEMHVKSSDWYRHKHQFDPAYSNVVLHVVYQKDREVLIDGEVPLPTMELKEVIGDELILKLNYLLQTDEKYPCVGRLSEIKAFEISFWLNRLGIERFESKVKEIKTRLKEFNYNWDTLLIHLVGEALVGPRNKTVLNFFLEQNDPQEWLAWNYSDWHKCLVRNRIINESGEFIKRNSDFPFVTGGQRFSSVPNVRLTSLFLLINNSGFTFEKLLKYKSAKNLLNFIRNIISEKEFSLTKERSALVLINAVCPLIFIRGQIINDQSLKEMSLTILSELKPEKNSIVNKWKKRGVYPLDAIESQGLLNLDRVYCNNKKCLNCAIGLKLLKTQKH